MTQVRAPHPRDSCASCFSLFAQLGDRDLQVRTLTERAATAERKAAELDRVVAQLARVELPTHSDDGHRLTVAGQVAHLVQAALYGWERPDA